MKIRSLTLSLVGCFAAVTLLSSCYSSKPSRSKPAGEDCSAIFETRDANGNKLPRKVELDKDGLEIVTECKVLKIKVDNNIKCEFVGSNKIDNLSAMLDKNKAEKIILVAPESKIRDLGKLSSKILLQGGIDIQKYLDSNVFKDLAFPYKGLRCEVGDKDIVIWTGAKEVILTIQDN